jgi:hypothetical protein
MAFPMNFFAKRRLRNAAILAAAIALCLGGFVIARTALRPTAIHSGLLFILLLFALSFLNGRKKLPFLPLWKASTWVQIHIYAGLFSVVLFFVHTGFRIPNGTLETILTILFGVVSLSGFFGLFISRWLPPRVTSSGESLVYERIPAYRHQLRNSVEKRVVEAERQSGSSAIGDFYLEVLAPYFQHDHGVAILLGDPRRFEHRLIRRIDEFSRYLDAGELETIGEIRELIDRKRNLDFQYAAQRVLKLWLFIHIPFTYSLLIIAVVHGWIALSYAGAL